MNVESYTQYNDETQIQNYGHNKLLVGEQSRDPGGSCTKGRYLSIIIYFSISSPGLAKLPFSARGGPHLSGPSRRRTGASLGYFLASCS